MKKVSIIVPVYNVEKYLRKCLESAMCQTLRDIEIICINDGSTDGSLNILKQLAEIDDRIKILDKPNSGYGHTMNMGIDCARGKYFMFLESDDYILPNMCEVLYELCEKHNLEIAKTDFYEFIMKGDKCCYRYRQTSDYHNYNEVLSPSVNTELFYASMFTWTCMYKREYINKYRIRHNETPGASYQDVGFWFQSLMHCKRLYLLNQAFYMYRQDNPNSSIYDKGKVYAFSDEFTIIREKIDEYEGDRKALYRICAFFNLHFNMISLKRVDKSHTKELIQLMAKDFELYKRMNAWSLFYLDKEFVKKLMVCILQQDDLEESVWKYIDKDAIRKKMLDKFDTYILYGAGEYARRTLAALEECKMWDKDVLCGVTSIDEPGREMCGIEIKEIRELIQYKDTALIIVCARKGTDNWEQMRYNLKEWGVEHVVHSNDIVIEDIWDAFRI